MSMSTSAPVVPELTTIDGAQYKQICEGAATILAPYRTVESEVHNKAAKTSNPRQKGEQTVFYNPIQQFNRDLSVLAILTYGEAALVEKEIRHRKKHEQVKRQKQSAKRKRVVVSPERESKLIDDGDPMNKRKRGDEKSEEPSDNIARASGDGGSAKRSKTHDIDTDQKEPEIAEQPHGNGVEQPHPDIQHASSGQHGHPTPKQTRPRFTILDALSATGLRALRYAKEIPFVTRVIANDLSRSAIQSIEKNIDHNDLGDKVCSNVADARAYMYSKVGNEPDWAAAKTIHRFDVIDLDPYGSAAPFLDAAVQALQDGGLLCVTCTDAGVFASNGYPEKAYALYGGIPTKGAHSHEGGLRLILQAIAKSAAKYGIAIEPLLSLSIDFYARLFVRVHKQPKDVKLLAGTTMIVYSCDYGCGAWTTQSLARNTAKESRTGEAYFKHGYAQGPTTTPFCDHCGSKTHVSGPMWAGPIHNPYFVQRILERLPSLDRETYATIPRIEGMLTVALEEDLDLDTKIMPPYSTPAPGTGYPPQAREIIPIPPLPAASIDPAPFFFIPNFLAKVLRSQTPSEEILRGALRHLKYRVSRSHCKAGSVKTDAPWGVIWEIMREWTRTKMPSKEGAVTKGTPGWRIMASERGSERAKVKAIQDEVAKMLKKSESLADTRTALEAALFRLGRETGANPDENQWPGIARTASGDEPSGQGTEDIREKTGGLGDLEVVFDEALGREKSTRRLCRYQSNPRPNWGPMNRAGGS